MSTFLLVAILVAIGLVIYKTWNDIETENSQPTVEVSTELIVETAVTDVVPQIQENATSVTPQITDAVTTKKPRKPRTPKVKDAGDK